MEKSQIPIIRLHESKPYPKPSLSSESKSSRPAVWDCGSTLYYSFERTSFQRHLDSAITANSARSLSMPHRTDLRVFPARSRSTADAPTTPRSSSPNRSRSFSDPSSLTENQKMLIPENRHGIAESEISIVRCLRRSRLGGYFADSGKMLIPEIREGPRAICIRSANGVPSNVTLRQPELSGGTLTYEIFSSKEEDNGEGKKSKGNEAKELLAKYGGAYLATSFTLSLISFSLFYLLISAGVDVQSLLQKLGILASETGQKVGTFALPYAAHKAASPIRFPPTVALILIVASWIGKKPYQRNLYNRESTI